MYRNIIELSLYQQATTVKVDLNLAESVSNELNGASVLKIFLAFMEPKCSLPVSQKPSTWLCTEPDEYSPQPHYVSLRAI
jgi:hypothetical protein